MALMRIDQSGLPPGVAGRARKDGKSDGSVVTLTDETLGGTTRFDLLYVNPADATARVSLSPTLDSHVWTFAPTSGVTGGIRIRLSHTTPGGVTTTQIRIFGIPDETGIVKPVPGERADSDVTSLNATSPAVIDKCERNWPTADFPDGNPFGWGLDLNQILTDADEQLVDLHEDLTEQQDEMSEQQAAVTAQLAAMQAELEAALEASLLEVREDLQEADGKTLIETSGPTILLVAAIPDLTLAVRVGTTVVGRMPVDFPAKTAPTLSDVVMFSDAAAGGAIKRATLAELLALVAAPVASSLTGNPYIDVPITPDSWNEEFTSSSDLGVLGFSVYNFTNSTAMSRIGGISGVPSPSMFNHQYRSSRFGSTLLLQLLPGKLYYIVKPSSGSYKFAARVGVPLTGSCYGGLFATTASAAPFGTALHNAGAGPGWTMVYTDAASALHYQGRQINAAQFADTFATNPVASGVNSDVFILNYDQSVSNSQAGGFACASSMQVLGTTIGATTLFVSPVANVGFVLNSGIDANGPGGTGIFALDYLRRMPLNSWFGNT